MRTSLTGPEPPAPAAIPLSLHPQGPAPPTVMRSWTRNLCPKPAAVKDIQEPSVKLAERRHAPALERATMALTTPSGHPALGSSETVVVSATPAAAASRWALGTSKARVRNQLAQPQVPGCWRRSFHGTSARLARVSTADQQPHLQVNALTAAACYQVFTETASSACTDRATPEQL